MVEQKFLDWINAHNKKFPNRKIDAKKKMNNRGYVMNEFIKYLQ